MIVPIVSLSSSGISRNPKCVVRDFRVLVVASGISERGAEEVDPKDVVELDEVEEEAYRNACWTAGKEAFTLSVLFNAILDMIEYNEVIRCIEPK
jgi:hypothetical protein